MKKVICTAGLAVLLGACGGPGGSGTAGEEETGNPFLSAYNTPFGVPPFERIELEHYLLLLNREWMSRHRKWLLS